MLKFLTVFLSCSNFKIDLEICVSNAYLFQNCLDELYQVIELFNGCYTSDCDGNTLFFLEVINDKFVPQVKQDNPMVAMNNYLATVRQIRVLDVFLSQHVEQYFLDLGS